MIHPNFVILGAIIAFLGGLSYLVDTLKGKAKPNRVTWLLWSVVPFIAFSAEINKGVGIQSLMTFMVGFNPLLIFLSSFINKKSAWNLGKIDYIMGGLSITGIICYFLCYFSRWFGCRSNNSKVFSFPGNGELYRFFNSSN